MGTAACCSACNDPSVSTYHHRNDQDTRYCYIDVMKTKVTHREWAEVVLNANMAAIQMLHASSADLINEPVDEKGTRAVHIAVRQQRYDLLRYLLQNGADLQLKGGELANTPLHDAVSLRDSRAIKWLLAFNANEDAINRRRLIPIQLCQSDDTEFRREYIRIKQSVQCFRKAEMNRNLVFGRESATEITVGGIPLATQTQNEDGEQQRKLEEYYEHENTHRLRLYQKRKEVQLREKPTTEFGRQVGIDMDEIGVTLHETKARGRLWNMWIDGEREVVRRQHQVYRVMFGLTWLALKNKYGEMTPEPRTKYVKQATKMLCAECLPQENGRVLLRKEVFIDEFHMYLYELHEHLLNSQRRKSRSKQVEMKTNEYCVMNDLSWAHPVPVLCHDHET